MEGLPVDFSHPAVRDYMTLIRLQVLTPLSLLINIAALSICAFVVNPSMGTIAKQYPTVITPRPSAVATYLIALYAMQLGYCILLVIARKPETKQTLIKGPGFPLVIANWVMAFWAICWIMKWFLAATVFQGIILACLLYSNLVLLIYHRPTNKRPLDTALIHAPMRFFLVLQLSLIFPLSLFITLGLTHTPSAPGPPEDYDLYQWAGFGVVFGTNFLGWLVVVFRRDIVWCVAATWVCVALFTMRPKPAPVYITAIVFTVLHPVGLLGSLIYSKFYQDNSVSLPGDDTDHPGLHNGSSTQAGRVERAPREVEADQVWS
ncbi:hypothetical protein CYLTODRAFT_374824 [Cylindrobasidium torrendii FP15055 ss-10]|uniref:Uncharacterized protein n=1 Tax=Cylindrobasidium torrendii FP15055 ss-10 TaxID=1314674 RepID=A0A0D7BET7_9AGAR|nr:hypothetical protein CYLTODRAFT_374824 [Cylindrobasidium torrendii FP15055 ss-10]